MDAVSIDYFRNHPIVVLALRTATASDEALASLDRTHAFLQNSAALRQLEDKVRAFNIFEALGVGQREIRHSRLLAWMLKADASHAQGGLFLRRFLSLLCQRNALRVDLGGLRPEEFEVECEDDRIDILLLNHSSRVVCAIENKIHATQSKGQLNRYRLGLKQRYPNYTAVFVFLTLRGEVPSDESWTCLTYEDLLNELFDESSERHSNIDARQVLYHEYVDWIRAAGEPSPANLLQILHLSRHELRHSDFLRWLLDPRASHEFGDRFLRYFLALVHRSGSAQLPENFETLDWSDLEVRREFEHIDLLILSERHRMAVVVENKVAARERCGQLGDYERFIDRHFARDHLTLVFLDMHGRQSVTREAINIGYDQLLQFFDDELNSTAFSSGEATRAILDQYKLFVCNKLWIWQGTTQRPPAGVLESTRYLVQEHGSEIASLVSEVRAWQDELASSLGTFLLNEAKELFESEIARRDKKLWFSFVPMEFDDIVSLRWSGADGAFAGRLVMYQFFVDPFGDTISERPPQLSLDVKMLAVKPEWEALKTHLHTKARAHPAFNRVRGERPDKFDHLLNHEIIGVTDVASSGTAELQTRVQQRLKRFHASIHQDIVTFFRTECAAFVRAAQPI